jgi:hypothetical protein
VTSSTHTRTAFADDAATIVAGDATRPSAPDVAAVVADLIRFLETGTVPDGLFAADVFADLSLPHWRVQAATAADVIALRTEGHPFLGELQVQRVEYTARGFVIEFTERWDSQGQRWYCREMILADVQGASITELSIYCTGDWDEAKQREHADAVRLIRP